jgi:hypothetical protein
VVEAIKDLIEDANFDCNNSGFSLQAMDSSHVSLVALSLRADGFEHYRCDRNVSMGECTRGRGEAVWGSLLLPAVCRQRRVGGSLARHRPACLLTLLPFAPALPFARLSLPPAGMKLANLSKILKCAGNDDAITMKSEDNGDTITFMFESPSEPCCWQRAALHCWGA